MKKLELQIGEKFNYWTILSLSNFESKKGERYYKCQCECGTIKDVRAHHIKNGNSKSCGCFVKKTMSKLKRIDIEGQKFGKLTPIQRVPYKNVKHLNHWLCKCECGNETIASTAGLRNGKNISCGCIRKGKENHNWKGGRIKTSQGYILIHSPEHPSKNPNGYVREHRLVMEGMIGRYLELNEEVHHKNGIRDDNSPENLELWVKSQPAGQRVEDMIIFCYDFLKKYKPKLLKNE
jgi:hypothetical protein